MNADLTFNSIAFKKSYDLAEESLRRSTTRGINTPDDLIIRSQSYTDSATKVAGQRFTGRVDASYISSEGQKYVVSAYFVLAVPELASSSEVTGVVTTFKAVVADANFITNVLNSEK